MTVQQLINYLSTIENKSKVVVVSDDDNRSDLYIKKETPTSIVLGQFYED